MTKVISIGITIVYILISIINLTNHVKLAY